MTEEPGTGVWSVVVPLKPLRLAKSRLERAAGPADRPRLALAFALDTVAAVLACPSVRDVTVVTDDPAARAELSALGALVTADTPQGGLNAALAHGARVVRSRLPHAFVAALNADLPALRPVELALVLDAARRHGGRTFLADADGVGTTLLTAAPATDLAPSFGGASRARHLASGATELCLWDVETVRRDVDTPENLEEALRLGVGRHTALAALRRSEGSPA
ncbi:2-phospho-L-lactate guanylyltransferase [Streptomyces sp. NPDC051940]|uniref:2-phospho-L-lactate guanylyltransferase n=1 Tax=Streptomyces sp. NPDC051940 TaxID=3155675 RepID=UPI0034445A96